MGGGLWHFELDQKPKPSQLIEKTTSLMYTHTDKHAAWTTIHMPHKQCCDWSQSNTLTFFAHVAIKPHLGSTLKSHCCDDRENWTDWLVWLNNTFHWPGLFILQTDAKSIQCFHKHTKLIENRFSRSKVIQNSIDQSVGTSHKALERLALRETCFHSWRWVS
jgi:hypothetical protein